MLLGKSFRGPNGKKGTSLKQVNLIVKPAHYMASEKQTQTDTNVFAWRGISVKSAIGRSKHYRLVHDHVLDSNRILKYLTDRLKSYFMDKNIKWAQHSKPVWDESKTATWKCTPTCMSFSLIWGAVERGTFSVLGKGIVSQIRVVVWYNLMFGERIRVLYFAFRRVRVLSATSVISFKQIVWVILSNRVKHKCDTS